MRDMTHTRSAGEPNQPAPLPEYNSSVCLCLANAAQSKSSDGKHPRELLIVPFSLPKTVIVMKCFPCEIMTKLCYLFCCVNSYAHR